MFGRPHNKKEISEEARLILAVSQLKGGSSDMNAHVWSNHSLQVVIRLVLKQVFVVNLVILAVLMNLVMPDVTLMRFSKGSHSRYLNGVNQKEVTMRR